MPIVAAKRSESFVPYLKHHDFNCDQKIGPGLWKAVKELDDYADKTKRDGWYEKLSGSPILVKLSEGNKHKERHSLKRKSTEQDKDLSKPQRVKKKVTIQSPKPQQVKKKVTKQSPKPQRMKNKVTIWSPKPQQVKKKVTVQSPKPQQVKKKVTIQSPKPQNVKKKVKIHSPKPQHVKIKVTIQSLKPQKMKKKVTILSPMKSPKRVKFSVPPHAQGKNSTDRKQDSLEYVQLCPLFEGVVADPSMSSVNIAYKDWNPENNWLFPLTKPVPCEYDMPLEVERAVQYLVASCIQPQVVVAMKTNHCIPFEITSYEDHVLDAVLKQWYEKNLLPPFCLANVCTAAAIFKRYLDKTHVALIPESIWRMPLEHQTRQNMALLISRNHFQVLKKVFLYLYLLSKSAKSPAKFSQYLAKIYEGSLTSRKCKIRTRLAVENLIRNYRKIFRSGK